MDKGRIEALLTQRRKFDKSMSNVINRLADPSLPPDSEIYHLALLENYRCLKVSAIKTVKELGGSYDGSFLVMSPKPDTVICPVATA